MPQTIDLSDLGFDRGAHLLIQRALNSTPVGDKLVVRGSAPALRMHLGAWSRDHGHRIEANDGDDVAIVKGSSAEARWLGAQRSGGPALSGIADRAEATWGLAARGSLVEQGGPELGFDLDEKPQIWSDLAPRLYAQAAASQWDPNGAIDWASGQALPEEIEATVVQIMTYMVENEQAALTVPARFLGRIHPHYREVIQFLAIQIADEARHVEVFSRRAGLHTQEIGKSTAGSRASLGTLLSEPDFALASFLLSVLGEGTFLNLLSFLERYAPDSTVRECSRLVLQDEARHVAFAMGHLEYQISVEPALRDRLRASIERRYESLRSTSGLGEEVIDALSVMAAGSWQPDAIAGGFAAVQTLQRDMAEGRERRLIRLGFAPSEAAALSALHTRNFM